MLVPELRERLALLQDPWQHHAPTLAAPWLLPLHGVHEWVLGGPIDLPPMHAFLSMVAAACGRHAASEEHVAHRNDAARAEGAERADDTAGSCVAWIGHAVMPSAVTMHRRSMDLRHHVRVPAARTPAERLWAFEEASRSGRCVAIVVDASGWNAAMVRRAQLASSWRPDRTPVLALAWRPQHEATVRSACTTRWLVQPMHDPTDAHARPTDPAHPAGPAWRIEMVRDRRGTLDHPAAYGILHEHGRSARAMPWSIAS
jgi:hypothetical protein